MDTNLVALNPEALAAVSGMFASDLNTTAGVRMLSTARCKFTIKDGSEEGISLGDEFDGIIAAEDSADHFIYYKSKYDPSAVTAPDAVWYRNTKAPACVPESALVRDADGRLGYQVKRRIVVFPFYKGKLMPDPVAFDVSGQSLQERGQGKQGYVLYPVPQVPRRTQGTARAGRNTLLVRPQGYCISGQIQRRAWFKHAGDERYPRSEGGGGRACQGNAQGRY